ncbi:DNA polymerase III subunit gamma/tau [Clostridium sp.]|uniref:DNA polymerase III subunit gamma/tau n=1 Tax=Clostridium sp. TaxID=1506 RepID=UPI00260D47B6|nr:DNA polymerase III subunit gamma/tau [Clostridium sp.]
MGYTALYREWRPQNFYDIVGQEHITTTLKNQILKDRIAHAYLLCGTRGTGKTTTAKVLAKALNCLDLEDGEPCNHCSMCKKIDDGLAIDITELDAASNNGIDKIRDIIDDVKYPPQEARFKVYIMDEVHMLSTGAVNAFLKTLEEPPKNVIFILATTDPQKLPITILSRCQRFDFKRINVKEIVGRLRRIVDEQNVIVDDKSLNLIARVSDGALRDALSILDQAMSMGNGAVEYDVLVSMLGLVTNDNLFNLSNAIVQRSVERSINIIDDVVYTGKDVYLFIKDLITHYRNILMAKVTNNPEEVLDTAEENIILIKEQAAKVRAEEVMRCIRILQEAETNAKASKQARIYLELAIVKMCKIEYDTSNEVILSRINKLEENIKKGNIKINQNTEEIRPIEKKVSTNNLNKEIKKKESLSKEDLSLNENSKVTLEEVKRSWKDILERFKARRAMIVYASMLTGKPIDCKNGILTIEYEDQFKFNIDRLEKKEYKIIIKEVLSEIFREDLKVNFKIEEGQDEERSAEDILIETLGVDMVEVFDE